MVSNPESSIVEGKTWINNPCEDPIVIRWDKVITVTEIKEASVITIYNNYLEDERYDINQIGEINRPHRNDVKNKLTQKMGYISTVEDARKYLEGVYKIKKES